ncbi:hypothetical protein Lser_V15G00998 [Lactuca serriola]
MSSSNNYGLPIFVGTSFPLIDDISCGDQGERLIPLSCISENRNHTLVYPPPPIILPNPRAQRLEKFKITQALLAMKHQDGRSVCTHFLEMKSHIDRLRVLGVIVSRKLAVDWVLQSLPGLYSEFIKDYYVTDHDMTLIDLTYLLVAAESAMIWRTGKTNLIERSTSQTSMDIDNGSIGSPEKISLPNGNRLVIVNPIDQMVKRKAKFVIVSCANVKEAICFYCYLKGHWKRSFPDYLKDLREGRIKNFDSASDLAKRRKLKGIVC